MKRRFCNARKTHEKRIESNDGREKFNLGRFKTDLFNSSCKRSHVIAYENLAGDYVKGRRDTQKRELRSSCGSPPSAFGLRSELTLWRGYLASTCSISAAIIGVLPIGASQEEDRQARESVWLLYLLGQVMPSRRCNRNVGVLVESR
jgi:hypothetical protein